jgi:hypothetical protein
MLNLHISDDAMSRFERTTKNTKLLANQATAFSVKTSIDECAGLCIQEKTFQCSSFSYCHYAIDVEEQCLISSAHPDVDKNVVVETTGCDVYASEYGYKIERFRFPTA